MKTYLIAVILAAQGVAQAAGSAKAVVGGNGTGKLAGSLVPALDFRETGDVQMAFSVGSLQQTTYTGLSRDPGGLEISLTRTGTPAESKVSASTERIPDMGDSGINGYPQQQPAAAVTEPIIDLAASGMTSIPASQPSATDETAGSGNSDGNFDSILQKVFGSIPKMGGSAGHKDHGRP